MARYIDADKYKADLLVGQEYLDEDTLLTATNLLDCQSTADVVEVKHGRWMHSLPVRVKSAERNIPIATEYLYTQCSECKHCFLMKMDGFNYCPNCGAKMDGKG